MFKPGWSITALILIASLIFLWLVKAPIVSAYISAKTGLSVTARMVSVWPSTTVIRFFRIANPPHFRAPSAFSAKKITVSYRFDHLKVTPSEIDQIVLSDVDLFIEIRNLTGSDNNWAAIGAKLKSEKGGREVIVHKLILKNMTVHIQGEGADKLGVSGTQYFDQMEFDEIDSKEGFPTKELVSQIFQKAGLIKYIEEFLNPTETIKEALNPLRIL